MCYSQSVNFIESLIDFYIRIINLIQNTFGVKKARPSKVESYLEVNT